MQNCGFCDRKFSGAASAVGEVASPAARDADFLARGLGVLDHQDGAAALAGLGRAHHARRRPRRSRRHPSGPRLFPVRVSLASASTGPMPTVPQATIDENWPGFRKARPQALESAHEIERLGASLSAGPGQRIIAVVVRRRKRMLTDMTKNACSPAVCWPLCCAPAPHSFRLPHNANIPNFSGNGTGWDSKGGMNVPCRAARAPSRRIRA